STIEILIAERIFMAFAAFQPNAFQHNAFQTGAVEERGSRIVAQTSKTPLYPKSWRELERAMAAKAKRERAWHRLPTLIKLRIRLEEFTAEKAELLDFSTSAWAQRRTAELNRLIADTQTQDQPMGRGRGV